MGVKSVEPTYCTNFTKGGHLEYSHLISALFVFAFMIPCLFSFGVQNREVVQLEVAVTSLFYITMAGLWVVTQVCSTSLCMVQCTHMITTGWTPHHLYNRGSIACWLTLCILEKIICNFTNSVQISFIQTLKLIAFSWTICWWQNVLMINEKNKFLTELVEWPLICRDLYLHMWMGVPDATSHCWKQSFSAVRVSGGCPGNDCMVAGWGRKQREAISPQRLNIKGGGGGVSGGVGGWRLFFLKKNGWQQRADGCGAGDKIWTLGGGYTHPPPKKKGGERG